MRLNNKNQNEDAWLKREYLVYWYWINGININRCTFGDVSFVPRFALGCAMKKI